MKFKIEDDKSIGYIYKIENIINKKVYIGLTNRSIKERFSEHLYDSYNKKSRSYNYHLHCAIRKYGIENFSIIELEECPIEKLQEREKYWIQYFDSYNNGYNMTLGGDGGTRYSYSEIIKLWNLGNSVSEIANKIECSLDTVRLILKKNNISSNEIINRRNESFMKVSPSKIIELWDNNFGITEIGKIIQIDINTIKNVLLNNNITEKDIKNRSKEKRSNSKKKKVEQYTLDGDFIKIFDSLSEAAKSVNGKISNISNVVTGRSNTAYGFKWKLKEEN